MLGLIFVDGIQQLRQQARDLIFLISLLVRRAVLAFRAAFGLLFVDQFRENLRRLVKIDWNGRLGSGVQCRGSPAKSKIDDELVVLGFNGRLVNFVRGTFPVAQGNLIHEILSVEMKKPDEGELHLA